MTDRERKQAAEAVEQFVSNLIEYVENVTGGDYPDEEGRTAVEVVAGSESDFWKALDVLRGGKE